MSQRSQRSQTLGFQTNSQSNRLTLGQTAGAGISSRRSKVAPKSTISQAIDDIKMVITIDGASGAEDESDGYYEYESDSSVYSKTDEDKHDGDYPEDGWSSDISIDVDFENKLPRPAANDCLYCGVGIQDGEVEWGCPHNELNGCNGVVHDNCFKELPTDYKCDRCFMCWNNK